MILKFKCFMKKIAILGANESIAILIKKAKELGYETHVFAWGCGDVGEGLADYFYPISISEKEKIYEKCKEIGISGICSITSDFAAPVVSYISRKFGFPSNPEKTDLLARNKFQMRETLSMIPNTYVPKHILVSSLEDINLVKNFNFPVIVKPTDRWSSKGVNRVDSYAKLNEAINTAIGESLEKKAVIEEFIDGNEYSAECIVKNGDAKILAFTKKETTGYPHYIETGHRQPSDLTKEKQEEITPIILDGIKSLGIQNSAAHVEFKITPSGKLGFIEIGARMGGDCIGTYLTPISTGLDYVKMVIDVACGNELDFTLKSTPKKVAVKFIIDESDILKMEQINSSNIVFKSSIDSSFKNEVIDSSTRHGYYIFTE